MTLSLLHRDNVQAHSCWQRVTRLASPEDYFKRSEQRPWTCTGVNLGLFSTILGGLTCGLSCLPRDISHHCRVSLWWPGPPAIEGTGFSLVDLCPLRILTGEVLPSNLEHCCIVNIHSCSHWALMLAANNYKDLWKSQLPLKLSPRERLTQIAKFNLEVQRTKATKETTCTSP